MAKEDDNGKFHSEQNGQFISKDTSEEKLAQAEHIYNDEPKNDESISYSKEQVNNNNPKYESGIKGGLSDLLGEEFTGVKGQDAIDKLLKERRGQVKGAFHREDIGDIDLLWGNDSLGLQHIIKQRESQGINVDEFLKGISKVIEKGKFYQKNERGNFEFLHNGKMAIIAPEYHGEKLTFVLTAYKTRKKRRS